MKPPAIVQPNLFAQAERVRTPLGVLETRFEPAPTPDGKPQAYWCWSEQKGHHAFTLDDLRPT